MAALPSPRPAQTSTQTPAQTSTQIPAQTPVQALSSRRPRANLLELWHLLSLDAPSVAALWTWFIAASVGLVLPLLSTVAMAVAVWMLYAADRLLDARCLFTDPLFTGDLEHRHRFHHRHRSAFLLGILAAVSALAVLVPLLNPAALQVDLVLGTLLAGYFILIHATGSAHRLPKEIAVGLFFAAAVFIPTVTRAPALRLSLLPAAALFALLCSLNCLFIYAWEHPHTTAPGSVPHPVTRIAVHRLPALTALNLVADLTLATLGHHNFPTIPWVLPVACALSTAILLLLHRLRLHLPALTLRAAADLALLTPLLLLHGLH